MTQRFRTYEQDSPWFLSFSYNACHSGPQTDDFENIRYPSGVDGVRFFGKFAAATKCVRWDAETICGDGTLWYARPGNFHACMTGWPGEVKAGDVFVCMEEPLTTGWAKLPYSTCAQLNALVPLAEMSTIEVSGHKVHMMRRVLDGDRGGSSR